jgi:hypothetical protein
MKGEGPEGLAVVRSFFARAAATVQPRTRQLDRQQGRSEGAWADGLFLDMRACEAQRRGRGEAKDCGGEWFPHGSHARHTSHDHSDKLAISGPDSYGLAREMDSREREACKSEPPIGRGGA